LVDRPAAGGFDHQVRLDLGKPRRIGEERNVARDRGTRGRLVNGSNTEDLGRRGRFRQQLADARPDRTPADEHGPHRTNCPRLHRVSRPAR